MISASFRKKGLGALIVESFEDFAKRQYSTFKIYSAVQINNPDGIRFWQKCGYKIDLRPIKQKDGTTTYKMEKSI
jgi:GNAT superfamily N-acetyltransferase